jgi:hypothetical protein
MAGAASSARACAWTMAGLCSMTTEPMAGASRAGSPWRLEACAALRPIDAAATRGVARAASSARLEYGEALRQSVPSTTSLTLSKEPGMMRVGQGEAADNYLGASARRKLAPFRAGTAWSRSRGQRGHERAVSPRVERTSLQPIRRRSVHRYLAGRHPHQLTVKHTRLESLRESLARAVLVCSRTPTLNSELGQQTRRARVVTSAWQSSLTPVAASARPWPAKQRARAGQRRQPISSSRQVPSEHHPCPSL